MKLYNKKARKERLSESLPQAISSFTRNLLTPLFSHNVFDRYSDEKAPLRSELFTQQQMEQLARSMARQHILIKGQPSERMLKRLNENEAVLVEVHQLLTETVKINRRIVPAGEWLLDNFYLIEEQIYTGKKHLPKKYSKGLPQLANGSSAGLPRVYDMIVELISHSDGRVDMESLSEFIRAYQSVISLQLGELWAIPIMLRLALIENLRRLSTQIAIDILHKNQADYWADRMIETAEKKPRDLVVIIADMAKSNPPVEGSFVAELIRRLQGRGASLALPLSWIEQQLQDTGITSNEIVNIENQKQAVQQVSVSNSIGSMRFLNNTDWRGFVERESIVEKILSEDPSHVYAEMDFYTKDRYRHVVEQVSKYSTLTEEQVARLAIEFSRGDGRLGHVGYYLIDKGIEKVETAADVRLPFTKRLRKKASGTALLNYILAIAAGTSLLVWPLISFANYAYTWQLVLFVIVCILAVSQSVTVMVNWVCTLFIRPNPLPRMNFAAGIPESCRTLVVVPAMLSGIKEIDELTEALEVRFVANRGKNIHFALLSDFTDAGTQNTPADEVLLEHAIKRIEELCNKYAEAAPGAFMFFHRPRVWNAREKKWMGYERKRGKLEQLNALLRGDASHFMTVIGDQAIFSLIKYIITLDSDTRLPREAAWKMAATLAHPLNKAVYNDNKKRVTEGYTILQPRVSNSLPGATASFYARIHGNEPGIDPYTRITSDVYQDLFAEGSFIGKGIYEIDMFSKALEKRFPENRILSHDLIEGAYARAGFLSDVQLYEEYPGSYFTDMKRRHRWIRGDWQIAAWLFPQVPAPEKQFRKNPLSALSKWKIFDNLRRSLAPIALLLLLINGWVTGRGLWWTCITVFLLMLPVLVRLLYELCNKPADIDFYRHILYTLQNTRDTFYRSLLDFVFIPYEAYLNAHAILLTVWRMFISKKRLLEWNPYRSSSSRYNTSSLASSYATMWIAPFFSMALGAYLWYIPSSEKIAALLLAVTWLMSPAIAWIVGRPGRRIKKMLSSSQHVFLQKLARRTWSFFEKFVTAEDNWLPPDNYQEKPGPKIAHRTSPTNIGLSLLANLTAFDFGYISAGRLLDRTSRTLNTIQALEKYRGHLYNWYDTTTLACLYPRYISTVDSGNFVGHILTFRQGLLHLKSAKIINTNAFRGLLDTMDILLEKESDHAGFIALRKEIDIIHQDPPQLLQEAMDGMERIKAAIASLAAGRSKNEQRDPGNTNEWFNLLAVQAEDIYSDLATMAPWLLFRAPSARLKHVYDEVDNIPDLHGLSAIQGEAMHKIRAYYRHDNTPVENEWLDVFVSSVINASARAKERVVLIDELAELCAANAMVEYDFLYSKSRHLLSIGYNAEEHRRDNSYYDLLASEARLADFVAIAQDKLPQESWFALGRQLTNVGGTPVLLSWSGSMFEYLMPLLVMPSYENTLLDQTHKSVVQKQIEYGRKRGIPWGMSESGYNMVDAALNFQYRAFGVPGLGLKRGLAEDLVIAPYSAVMSLMVMPAEACANLQEMEKMGFAGEYGFYEAIDYTSSRLPRGQGYAILRSFMAHHQGMSFLSLSHLLLNQPLQKRFASDVRFQATLLLLQERIPRVSVLDLHSKHISDTGQTGQETETPIRVINTPHTPVPDVQLLSNGRYHVMITNAGGGYSRWKDLSVTRWREDGTRDNWGSFCYIRDMDSGEYWSSAFQPSLTTGDHYEAVFSQGRAEFRRRDHGLETHTEIVVSPEDDVELRRLHIANRLRKKRSIEITSYAEVVLTTQAADMAHPAFSNLFVQTELLQEKNTIVCTRRPRSEKEQAPSMFHLMKVHQATVKQVSYETDRMKFTGRGNNSQHPVALRSQDALSCTQGSVLDPVVAVRYVIEVEPQSTVIVDMVTGIADTRQECLVLVDKYQDKFLVDRGFELSWTHSQIILQQINASESDAQLYSKLAGAVIYLNQSLRASPDIIVQNHRGQSGLWGHSVSGDLPVVLVKIENPENIELVKQLIQAHAYWRLKGLTVDLVIWNEDHGNYRHTLQNQIMSLVAPLVGAHINENPGGVFIRSADQLSHEDRLLFEAVARIVLSDKDGALEEQLSKAVKGKTVIPYFTPLKFYPSQPSALRLSEELLFFNGTGGFSKDGKEYVIQTDHSGFTPVPWCNVLANPCFGSVVSESGQAYSWRENAHEYRLTPWNNDPVGDLEGECYYVRDEESGKFWSPAPLPVHSNSPYITRHGLGYSVFEHMEDGIYSVMTAFVELETGVKFTILSFSNRSARLRKLSVTGYIEWVLGEFRTKTQMHVVTRVDAESAAVYASNAYNTDFANRTAFFDANESPASYTCDRKEFIGRNGSLRNPEAMSRVRLSGRSGAALDPCAALQLMFELAENESHEVIFKLGAGKDLQEAAAILQEYKTLEGVYHALQRVKDYWTHTSSAIIINTPDTAVNLLANNWLTYQALACRVWGRSGYYQSGGAFGFRDQLQDVLSLLHAQPLIARNQLLLHASRQFKEGDVQHWWHPPVGRGVRTTCSDDFLWLPYAVIKYVNHTGDTGILNEQVTFIEGRPLNNGEESYYDLPVSSNLRTSLYDHCARAIKHAGRYGPHGLPLIGSGDWNDGMDKVGEKGKGESVWLAFFLYEILVSFASFAEARGESEFAGECRADAKQLQNNIETSAWDGEWYRRAYFDDGTPLGSAQNEECRIDSIAQSWSVLSGAGKGSRVKTAMDAAAGKLIRRDAGLIQLLDPPFDRSDVNPGYIKGYVPGVRENGGQYTHAAIWFVMALLKQGNRSLGWEMLQMINPVNRGKTPENIARYKVEPYVMAADVYTEPLNAGRGGWTWYTGSAGWMYQLIVEYFLGLQKKGDKLYIRPNIPVHWTGFGITYRYIDTFYNIHVKVKNTDSEVKIITDDQEGNGEYICLENDGKAHEVEILFSISESSHTLLPQSRG
ncbi:MAG: cyclic beta 1-2 glucan synthetase [Chitinophagaceae bacterium]|nr:cyclic beta 1-2 glucan synthetase [Chitinophagaceae bacterium]